MKRGPYAGTPAKREEILAAALELIGREGYGRATVREIAGAVGISTTGLMHHFEGKEALLTEVLRRRDALESVDELADKDASLVEGLPDLVHRNAAVPGLVQLYVRLSGEATDPAHSSHEYFRERYERVREEFARAIAREQGAGRLSRAIDARVLATAVVAMVDGLQSQLMYDPTIDMGAVVASVLAALSSDAGTTD